MENKPSCFVIIGFGNKTSYANGKVRVLNLDQTYQKLIKPAFDTLDIPCYRAIDLNRNGSIDELMLKQINEATIALVDISTLNANVMWELGVRHALKERHTILICESEQIDSGALPFDINHNVVHKYTYSEAGISDEEAVRFTALLSSVVKDILQESYTMNDSPVFSVLRDELKATTNIAGTGSSQQSNNTDTLAIILDKAEAAKKSNNYSVAIELFGIAKIIVSQNKLMQDDLPFILCRLALCTYKSKKPNELEALIQAKSILEELKPAKSQDIEVLGLSGAINKRLNEITNDTNYLDNAINFYERGFNLKQDYYNGINTAFMRYKKAALLKSQNENWEDAKIEADSTRIKVRELAIALEKETGFNESGDAIWVLLTLAEVYNYQHDADKMKEYEDKARNMAEEKEDDFAMGSYEEQKKKIAKIFEQLV